MPMLHFLQCMSVLCTFLESVLYIPHIVDIDCNHYSAHLEKRYATCRWWLTCKWCCHFVHIPRKSSLLSKLLVNSSLLSDSFCKLSRKSATSFKNCCMLSTHVSTSQVVMCHKYKKQYMQNPPKKKPPKKPIYKDNVCLANSICFA